MTFDFNDINLIPKYFNGTSRSDLDTTIKFGNYTFKNPVIPANMVTIVDADICLNLAKTGYFYVMHRFDIDPIDFIEFMHKNNTFASISLGVQAYDLELVKKMKETNTIPEFVTIDIAHGHSRMMREALNEYKKLLPNTFFICGNVCTIDGAADLEKWGADAIKVGVAPGKSCTTYFVSGFGSRYIQPSIMKQIVEQSNVPLICDGGIEHPGDIAKAIVMGADMVMCGAMVAGCSDSPGELVEKNDKKYMVYYGSASANMGKTNRIEGTSKLIPYKDRTIVEQMKYLTECLQSSISYGGGHVLNDLRNVNYIIRPKS